MADVSYEIKSNGNWITVNEWIFRSWTGERRINGELYNGEVFYLDSAAQTVLEDFISTLADKEDQA